MRLPAQKKLGQNFLVDKNIRDKIITACQLSKADTVLEIGPGLGALTEELSKRVKKVIAVEIDSKLCDLLKEKFKDRGNIEVIHKDILKFKIPKLNPPSVRKGRLKVIGNLPYYITTPIITHILQHRHLVKEIYICVQKEVAQRLTAAPKTKEYGSFSCFVQFYTKPYTLFYIKKNSFKPIPKIDSAFLKLEIYRKPAVCVKDETVFFKIIRLGFSQRRKMLKNNLKGLFSEEKILSVFEKAGLPLRTRAEELSLSNFSQLSNFL